MNFIQFDIPVQKFFYNTKIFIQNYQMFFSMFDQYVGHDTIKN